MDGLKKEKELFWVPLRMPLKPYEICIVIKKGSSKEIVCFSIFHDSLVNITVSYLVSGSKIHGI